MKKVLIGLLVGICVIMFSLPLMAADSPKCMDLSTLQKVDDTQLSQMKGQGVWTGPPPGFANFEAGYPYGVSNAFFFGIQNSKKPNYPTVNGRAFNVTWN